MANQTLARRPVFARRSTQFPGLSASMDRFVNEALWGTPFRTLWASTWNGVGNGTQGTTWPLPLDVYATQDDVVIIAAVPGLAADNVEVTYDQGVVTFAGQLPNVAVSEEGKGATWYLHELPYGTFRRSVTLPFEIDADAAEATFADGVLRLRLPKAEQARPRQIKVRNVENGHAAQPAEAIPAETN
jgi:HSP20 family protein